MQISRRNALMGATAAAVVTGALTVPLAIKAAGAKAALAGGPGGISASIQQRYAEWQIARQSLDRALDNLAVVEQRAWAVAKERGIEHGWTQKAFMRELGVDAAHDRESRTSDEYWEAYRRLLNTPADSVQDMALKRRVALVLECDEAKKELVEALGRDLERLACVHF